MFDICWVAIITKHEKLQSKKINLKPGIQIIPTTLSLFADNDQWHNNTVSDVGQL